MTINRLNQDNKGIGIITKPNAEDTEIAYCPDCSEFRNKLHKLGPLIILDPSKPLPPDYDDFKQCGWCYKKVPIYDVRYEGRLGVEGIEPVRNPFDSTTRSEGIIKKGLKNRIKDITKRREKADYSKDKEVMNEVKDGAIITGYYSSEQKDK